MKILKSASSSRRGIAITLTVFVALSLIGVGSRWLIAPSYDHNGLEFNEVVTSYKLTDPAVPNPEIEVVWRPRPTPGSSTSAHDYIVTVKIPKAATGRTYSLLTLGLQSRDERRKITCVKFPAELLYTPKKNAAPRALQVEEPVGKFNQYWNKANYGTFTFNIAETFEFVVTGVRETGRATKWYSGPTRSAGASDGKGHGLHEHDNDPPKNPPD